jgi:3',5'-cyclic AMP phosphodiesterase CpdA
MMPLLKAGMEVRVAAGNHELMSLEEPWGSQRCGKRLRPYVPLLDNVRAFKESLGDMLAGEAGPESDLGMTYSFNIGGCHFAVLAAYTMFQHNSISNQTIKWLDEDLQKARARNLKLFVVSHPPAFPGGGHMWDALPFYDPDYNCEGYDDRFGIDRRRERDRFWNILKKHKVVAYLCGHEHNIQIQNVEGVWHIVSGGLAPTLYPLNGVQQGQDANTILYDGQLQNPRASTIWPWNETRQSYWGWCLVTVLGDEATLEVFGAERMPVKKDDLRLLKKFVLREAGADL